MRRALVRSLLTATLAPLAIALACGPAEPAPPVVTVISTVVPAGTLAGVVVVATSGAPLDGVAVKVLNAADKEATTEGDGTFRIDEVPASTSIAIRYHKDGFVDALDQVTIPSSAGNLAQDNGVGFSGPVGLFGLDAGGTLELVVRGLGAAETAFEGATIHVGAAYMIAGVPRGNAGVDIAAGTGRAVMAGLPDLFEIAAVAPQTPITAVVRPAPASGLLPKSLTSTVGAVVEAGAFIVDLPAVGGGVDVELEITESDVLDLIDDADPILPSRLATTAQIGITFNQPVAPETLFVRIVDEDGDVQDVEVVADAADASSFDLIVAEGTMPPAAEMNVLVEVVGSGGDALFTRQGTFFTEAGSTAITILGASVRASPGGALACPTAGTFLQLELSQPVGARDGDGEPVVAPAQLLPIRVSSTAAPFEGTPFDDDDDGTAVADLTEVPSGQPSSGFTSRLVAPWPAGAVVAATTGSFQLPVAVAFNDVALAVTTGRGPAVVRLTDGTPADVVAPATLPVTTTSGCP